MLQLDDLDPGDVLSDESAVPTSRVSIPRAPTTRAVRRSLAIASGFGGPTAVVALAGS